jgi:phage terminase small subunit
MADRITRAQIKFVDCYIEQDFTNATAAYQRAFPKASYETARRNASILLTKTDIQDLIRKTLSEIIDREKIPLEKRILDYWTRRAFYDITGIIGLDGTLKITEEQLRETGLAVCIDSVNRKTDAQGHETITYKFADKDEAVKMLQGYIQMIKPQTQKIEIGGLSDEARARLALLYEEETPDPVSPVNIEPQTEAPDDD